MMAGQRVGAESSILKCRGTEVLQEISQLAVEAVAYYANPFDANVLGFGANESAIGPDYAMSATGKYLNLRKASIYGGSNEIQRSIVAKLILGL